MDRMDGTIKQLYEFINDKINPEYKIEFIRLVMLNVLLDIQSILEPLKQKEFLFTHTDLKLENVFYVRKEITKQNFEEKNTSPNVKLYSTIQYSTYDSQYKSNFACVDNKIFEQKIKYLNKK